MGKKNETETAPNRGGLPKLDKKKTIRDQIKTALEATYTVTDDETEPQKHGGDMGKARDSAVGRKRSRAVAGLRTAAALEAWDATPSGGTEPFAVGGLIFQQLRPFRDEQGQIIGVEVFLGGGVGPDGKSIPLSPDVEAHYRIVNPPTLIPDGAGSVELGRRKYREDPLASIAAAIENVKKGRDSR